MNVFRSRSFGSAFQKNESTTGFGNAVSLAGRACGPTNEFTSEPSVLRRMNSNSKEAFTARQDRRNGNAVAYFASARAMYVTGQPLWSTEATRSWVNSRLETQAAVDA